MIVAYATPELELTGDDREVLRGLMCDKTIKEIAGMLDKAPSTIDVRIKNLKDKLGVETLPGLVASAMRYYLL